MGHVLNCYPRWARRHCQRYVPSLIIYRCKDWPASHSQLSPQSHTFSFLVLHLQNLGGTGSLVPVESVAAEVNGGMRTARSSALAASFSDGTTTGFQLPNEAPSTRNLPLLLATVPTRPALSPHRLMLLGSAMFAVLLSIGVVLFRAISWTSEETAELWHYAVNITDLYNVCSKAVSSFSLTQLLSTA